MRNRAIGLLVLSFLSGALGAGVVLFVSGALRFAHPIVAPPAPVSAPPSAPQTQPPGRGSDVKSGYATASQELLAGRLQEAQDDFLEILLSSTGSDPKALRGLVTVRRRLAHDNNAVLRQQAAVYRQAIAQNADTEEHYSSDAMEWLAKASLLAASEIESERQGGRTPLDLSALAPAPARRPALEARPRPSPRPLRRNPSASGTPQVRPSPTNPTPQASSTPSSGTPDAQATPPAPVAVPQPAPPPPPLDPNEPFYIVQIGPISDPDRASELAGELTVGGFAPRINKREEPPRFQVVSEAVPRAVAERRGIALAEQGLRSTVRVIAGGLAQLDFGAYPSQESAQALARRIRALGYPTVVAREGGTFYTITLGPYRQTAVDAIAGIVAGFHAPITVSASP